MPTRSLVLALALVSASACSRDETPEARQAGTIAGGAATKLSAAADQFVQAGDVRLRYRDVGSGTPIVFIHGYSRSLEDWLVLADSFPSHRVIAYDVRGFGRSTRITDVRRHGDAYVEDVAALLDHLKIDRAHLVGHSMGALIAANVAVAHPQRVASATLIAGPTHTDSAAFARETAPWVRDLESGVNLRKFISWLFPGTPDSVARGMSAQAMAANDSMVMVTAMRAMPALAIPTKTMTAATVPVFVTVGGRDPLAPYSRTLAKHWPGAQLLEVPDMDHVTIMNHPQVLAGIRAIAR